MLFQTIIDWQGRMILREESWHFPSQHDADTILTRLQNELDRMPTSRWIPQNLRVKGQKEFFGQAYENKLQIMRRSSLILSVIGIGRNFFIGSVVSTSSGSLIKGIYRVGSQVRGAFLFSINAYILWWLIVLANLVYQLVWVGDYTFAQEKTLNSLLVFLVAFPVGWLGYKFFGFFKFLETGSREAILTLLKRVTNDIGIKNKN